MALFVMRATIPRSPKKAIVEIFINSEENVCVAFKFKVKEIKLNLSVKEPKFLLRMVVVEPLLNY